VLLAFAVFSSFSIASQNDDVVSFLVVIDYGAKALAKAKALKLARKKIIEVLKKKKGGEKIEETKKEGKRRIRRKERAKKKK
jgi:hypothetical protein